MLHISYIIDIYYKGYPIQCEVAFVVLVGILIILTQAILQVHRLTVPIASPLVKHDCWM